MKTLHLNLKRKWFDMIKSCEKKEEYREIKDYWIRRLVWFNGDMDELDIDDFRSDLLDYENRFGTIKECFKHWGAYANKFDVVEFKNGYQKTAPVMNKAFKNIQVRPGKPEWGAEPGKKYFVIELGELCS